MKRQFAVLFIALGCSGLFGATAPRCLDEAAGGVIKNYGELVISVEPVTGSPRSVGEITGILNAAETESSALDWTYTTDDKGTLYFSVKWRTWRYDPLHDSEASFQARHLSDKSKVYEALDQLVSRPGVQVACDVFPKSVRSRRSGLSGSLSWVKPSSFAHWLGAGPSETLVQVLRSLGLNSPTSKDVWFDIRTVVCQTSRPVGPEASWTCFLSPYGERLLHVTGSPAGQLARLLFEARAEAEDVRGWRTLKVENLLCTAKEGENGALNHSSCRFQAH